LADSPDVSALRRIPALSSGDAVSTKSSGRDADAIAKVAVTRSCRRRSIRL